METLTRYRAMHDPIAAFTCAECFGQFDTEQLAREAILQRAKRETTGRFYIFVDTVDAKNTRETVSSRFIYV